MLAALLANLPEIPVTQSGVSRLSRHREWQDPQDHPRYTDLSSGKWEKPSPSVLSLPLFGGQPIELIQTEEPAEETPGEVLEPHGVIDLPAFLDFQERKTVERNRETGSLILLEDEELVELLLVIGEI